MERISRLWLLWFGVVMCVLTMIGTAAIYYPPYAKALIWSFTSAETAIAYWHLVLGFGTTASIGIAIVCGQLDLLNWFWLADQISHIARHAERKFNETNRNSNGALERHAKRAPYVLLAVMGFVPWQTPIGVAVAKVFQLDTKAAFAAMCAGNVLKMIAWGLGFQGMSSLFHVFMHSN